ncbi:hypothetical protein [Methylobacterium aerolatum]|uniref:Uncharacterized protein n=1 Tax=Methylobacterium aerolatum TaxID=418708 RepID=A0ABU0I2U8_9HYPH|nr:hypothetical protein [Methylobacterium aerolatum]MDQ0448926.1 hypothetical protein [Methylobacterium aerolatum]
MTSSRRPFPDRSGPNGPIVLARNPRRPQLSEYGAPPAEAPLPGRLLVALSRLHRAETRTPKAPGKE